MTLEQVYHQPPEGGDAVEMLLISDCEAEIPYVTAAEDGNAVFSVWCIAESGGTITVRIGAHTEEIDVSGEWNRITIFLTEFERTDRIVIGEYGQNEVYLYKAQLESGNKLTDWKPAPEDAESGIAAAQQTAEDVQQTAAIITHRLDEVMPYLNPTPEGFELGLARTDDPDLNASTYTTLLANDGYRVRQYIPDTKETRIRQMVKGGSTTSPEYRVGEPESAAPMCVMRVAPDGGIMFTVEEAAT